MINRRTFLLALGATALATPAMAEIRVNGRRLEEDKRKFRDIPYTPLEQIPNHRQFMRDIVIELSAYAKNRVPQFPVLVRDAPELLIKGARESDWETARDIDGAAAGKYTPAGSVIRPYLKAIDGILFDGLFCGRDEINKVPDDASAKPFLAALEVLKAEGRAGLSIEYATDKKEIAAAAKKCAQAKTLSFIDQEGNRALGRIPAGRPAQENPEHVTDFKQARNFLPMQQSIAFGSRGDWVAALADTNYDLLILDPFWRGSEALTADDIKTLKLKRLGTRRQIFASLSLSRAQDTRFYWKKEWAVGNPPWLAAPAQDSPSQTLVRYWEAGWKEIVGQYLQGLIDLGVDGVLLDHADAYFYFEDMMPLR